MLSGDRSAGPGLPSGLPSAGLRSAGLRSAGTPLRTGGRSPPLTGNGSSAFVPTRSRKAERATATTRIAAARPSQGKLLQTFAKVLQFFLRARSRLYRNQILQENMRFVDSNIFKNPSYISCLNICQRLDKRVSSELDPTQRCAGMQHRQSCTGSEWTWSSRKRPCGHGLAPALPGCRKFNAPPSLQLSVMKTYQNTTINHVCLSSCRKKNNIFDFLI